MQAKGRGRKHPSKKHRKNKTPALQTNKYGHLQMPAQLRHSVNHPLVAGRLVQATTKKASPPVLEGALFHPNIRFAIARQ